MKKNQKHGDHHDVEILKAVAQAWHGHSSSSKAAEAALTSEFDAHRMYFKGRLSRFKLEAMSGATKTYQCGKSWDFGQSLWDSYEIISVSKKLETGLVLNDPFSALNEEQRGVMRRKESNNSLRSLFNRMSSRRFREEDEFPSKLVD
ncbi:hypothetical protein C2S52_015393 [Perilla frutescens var. hirtella]|uniref:Uncharacterized protein n=1 Tax=Perilla frutescens var. hirtella TaxID=608512 RepID=A0AAD4JEL1_PERFH|nr:hypothetical protein C2S52_015393 [Perilla frutescens var. hirtella]KAH6815786.1 hypothetical protein C2S51_020606 [Perilla frutescens var. frutescens]KAH6832312.1 hypothetical protein C2S53_005661 [Perilla frutescens var. hirtella]